MLHRSTCSCRFARVALLPGLLAYVVGCNGQQSTGHTPDAVAPVPVLVATVVQADVPVRVRTIGWVEGYATVTVKARVDGQLTGIHFAKGQDVKVGDLLFTIDPRPFEAAVRLAEANLARDKALAADAEKDARWKEDLYKQGTAAQREADQSRANAESLKATVQADQASLDTAKLNLQYCTIRSPLNGRAGDHLVDVGNMVKANETSLVVIDQIEPIYVAFSVPEMHLAAIKTHMAREQLRVEAVIPGDEERVERGVLTFLDNKVDVATGTIRLKATFENTNHRLWPGQYVNVTLVLVMERNVLVVPTEAVQIGQKGQFVFVLKPDQTVEYRDVTVGRTVDNRTVIPQGLKAGETVVTDGQLRLVPGAKAVPKERLAAGSPTHVQSSASSAAAKPSGSKMPSTTPSGSQPVSNETRR